MASLVATLEDREGIDLGFGEKLKMGNVGNVGIYWGKVGSRKIYYVNYAVTYRKTKEKFF